MTQVDRLTGLTAGVSFKAPVKAVTSSEITLSGEQTVAGVGVVTGDRVLVADQSDQTKNGIYNVDTSGWSRALDFDGSRDAVSGTLVTQFQDASSLRQFRLTTADPVIFGTSAITFREITGTLSSGSGGSSGGSDFGLGFGTGIGQAIELQNVIDAAELAGTRTLQLVSTDGALQIEAQVTLPSNMKLDLSQIDIDFEKFGTIAMAGSLAELPESNLPRLATAAAAGATTVFIDSINGSNASLFVGTVYSIIRGKSDAATRPIQRWEGLLTVVDATDPSSIECTLAPALPDDQGDFLPQYEFGDYEEATGTVDRTLISVVTSSELTSDVDAEELAIPVSSIAGFAEGDMCLLVDNRLAADIAGVSQNSIRTEPVTIRRISGSTIYTSAPVARDYLAASGGRILKVSPTDYSVIVGARSIRLIEAPENPGSRIHAYKATYTRNCLIEDPRLDETENTYSMRGQCARIHRSWNSHIRGGYRHAKLDALAGSGDIYGASLYYCGGGSSITQWSDSFCRHGLLAQGSVDFEFADFFSFSPQINGFDCHGLDERRGRIHNGMVLGPEWGAEGGNTRSGGTIGNTFHAGGCEHIDIDNVLISGFRAGNNNSGTGIRISPNCRNIRIGSGVRLLECDRGIQANVDDEFPSLGTSGLDIEADFRDCQVGVGFNGKAQDWVTATSYAGTTERPEFTEVGLILWSTTETGTSGASTPDEGVSPVVGVTTSSDGTLTWTYQGAVQRVVSDIKIGGTMRGVVRPIVITRVDNYQIGPGRISADQGIEFDDAPAGIIRDLTAIITADGDWLIDGGDNDGTILRGIEHGASAVDTSGGSTITDRDTISGSLSLSWDQPTTITSTMTVPADRGETILVGAQQQTGRVNKVDPSSGAIDLDFTAPGVVGQAYVFEVLNTTNAVRIIQSGSGLVNGSASNLTLGTGTTFVRIESTTPDIKVLGEGASAALSGTTITATGNTDLAAVHFGKIINYASASGTPSFTFLAEASVAGGVPAYSPIEIFYNQAAGSTSLTLVQGAGVTLLRKNGDGLGITGNGRARAIPLGGDVWSLAGDLAGGTLTPSNPGGWANRHLTFSAGRTVNVANSTQLLAALQDALAGDDIILADGAYTINYEITRSGSGDTDSGFVMLRAANSRGATISPATATQYSTLRFGAGASYWIMDGLDVTANAGHSSTVPFGGGHCVDLSSNNTYVIAYDCEFHDAGGGGFAASRGNEFIRVTGCDVYGNCGHNDFQTSGISTYQPRPTAGNTIETGPRIIFDGNWVWDNSQDDWENQGNGRTEGLKTDGNGIIIDDGHNDQPGGTGINYIYPILVENNVLFRNGAKGLQVFVTDNVTARNNTIFYNNQDVIGGTWNHELGCSTSDNCDFYNNLMQVDPAQVARGVKSWGNVSPTSPNSNIQFRSSLTYNSTDADDSYRTDGGNDAPLTANGNELGVDPQITTIGTTKANSDYTLNGASVCVDAGSEVVGIFALPATDIDGNTRVVTTIDMGATEQ